MHYLWWIPLCIFVFSTYAWLSKQNNEIGGNWIWITFAWGALWQLWAIVSRVSKNLLFDGILYDNISFLTYTLTLIIIGGASKLNSIQLVGLGLIIAGSVLMKVSIQ